MKKNIKISKAVAAVLLLLAVAASYSLFFSRNIYSYQTEAHRNLQEVTQHAETLRRLEETEDIWLSRWKNQEMYADLKEKYQFRQANFNFEEQQSNVEKLTVVDVKQRPVRQMILHFFSTLKGAMSVRVQHQKTYCSSRGTWLMDGLVTTS